MPILGDVQAVSVQTHIRDFVGMSGAALVICDDGNKYVIKRASLGRPLVAEHVVGRLGLRIGAPCMNVALATVPDELIALDTKLSPFKGGLAHASGFIDGLVEIRKVTHEVHPLNRARFALIYILFSWTYAADHQFMYELQPPNLVYSHDHGLFFVGNHVWTAATLAGGHVATPDGPVGSLGFSPAELAAGRHELAGVTDQQVADIVKSVPEAWGVNRTDLDALVTYLCARKKTLLALLPVA
jgi:hypothetical protein